MPEPKTEPETVAPVENPPHAPEAGWSRRLLGSYHVTGVFWYRFHSWAARRLPEPLFGPVIFVATTFFWLFLRNIRAAAAANLEPVLGPCGWWERQRRIFRTFRSFAWCLTERYERLGTDHPFRVEPDSLDLWLEVAQPGRGFLLVTAHLGNYEVGSMLPAQMEQRRVHLVREPEADAKAQEFLQQVIGGLTQEHYRMHFQSDDPLQGMALLDALRNGDVVAVQGDRPRAGAKSIDATLFGMPFPLPSGPAALARTAGVPMLPAFVFREGRRRYRLVFRPPIVAPRTADRSADLAAAMRQVAAEVEWAIRREPHQWFCFRRLWP